MTTITLYTQNKRKLLVDSTGVTVTTNEAGEGFPVNKPLLDFIKASYYLLQDLDPEMTKVLGETPWDGKES